MIITNYTFDASAKTITFNDIQPDLKRINLITNLTSNHTVIYQFQKDSKGGTLASNVLTLTYDTTSMSDTDELKIEYNPPETIVQTGALDDDSDSLAQRGLTQLVTGFTASSVADLIPATNVSKYAEIHVKLSGTWAGFVQFSFSPTGSSSDFTAYMVVGANSTFAIPRKGNWFKAQVTTYTSGTINASLQLFATPTNLTVGRTGYPVPSDLNFIGMQDNGGNLAPFYTLAGIGDNASGNRPLGVGLVGFDGANSSRLRYGTIYKSASATATGATTIWTPTATKKFRLLGYQINVSNNALRTGTGQVTIKLVDSATSSAANDIHSYQVFVPTTAATTMGAGWSSGWVFFGELGRLSGAADRILTLNLSTALTAGAVSVNMIGTEE